MRELPTYKRLRAATRTFLASVDHFLQSSLEGKAEEAGAFWSVSGAPQSKAFRKALSDEVAATEQFTGEYLQAGLSAARWAALLSCLLLFLAIAAGVTLGTFTVRSISLTLRAATQELREEVKEVLIASDETAAAGRERTSSCRRNAKRRESAAATMVKTKVVVLESDQKLKATLDSMQQITESADHGARTIRLIDEISFKPTVSRQMRRLTRPARARQG